MSTSTTSTPTPTPTANAPAADGSTTPPGTTAEDKLRAALSAEPASTAAELALVAGVGRSTAAKILARWADDGTAVKVETSGSSRGPGRTADRWALAHTATTDPTDESTATADPTDADPTDADPTDTATADSTDADPTDANTTDADTVASVETGSPAGVDPGAPGSDGSASPAERRQRLAPGGLRGMVEDHLREHPGQSFGPSQIAKELDRSSGAVANALEKLVAAKTVERTQDGPRRYALAPGI